MKKTIFMLPALALMLFAACSSEDAVTKDNTAQLNETPENAIGFNAYLNRTTTRAGVKGELDNTALQAGENAGFGVFAYYADGDLYTENATPNFMYNQHVWYNSGDWKYEPVKYWPNEFGSQAISTGVDRVTFFAYAPYVAVEPATGQLTSTYTGTQTTTGITSLTRNGKSGDPYVRYVGTFDHTECVDLCYGVAAEAFTSSVGSGDGANSINKGEPYINVAKPAVGSKIYFDFKHALAKLTVNVDADVDIVSHADGEALDGKTRIWVRSITFDGIAQRGYLNLNSGIWYDIMDNNKISHASVTIHDGRRDGSEALSDDTYESPTGFANALVQKDVYTASPDPGTTFPYTTFTSTTTGVTAANQDLFGGSLMVIPANEQLKVTIVYDVETADATLPTYLSDGSTKGSTVENKITKSITLGGSALKLESGKAYTLNLHLGMTSVTFNASVSEWTDGGTADNTWLPVNGPTVKAGTPNYPYSVPAAAGTYTFRITDLTAGSTRTVTVTPGTKPITFDPVTPTFANEDKVSGILTANISAANTSVYNKTATITLTESNGGSTVTNILITQAGLPLGLNIGDAAQKMSGDKDIVLSAGTGVTIDWSADVATPTNDASSSIIVKKNGTTLTYAHGSDFDADGEFDWDASYKKIKLYTAAKAGEVYTITVKAGDAEAETVSFTVLKKDGTLIAFTKTADTYSKASWTNESTAAYTQTTSVGTGEDGTITYSIARTTGSGADASVDSDGKVYFVDRPTTDDVYTVTATVADGANYTYAEKTKTYTITITD